MLSPHYSAMLSSNRPVIANNVLAWLMAPALVCGLSRDSLHNVVADGTACGVTDVVGDPVLSPAGGPTAGSTLRDRPGRPGARAARLTSTARRGSGPPDIGAYEFSG